MAAKTRTDTVLNMTSSKTIEVLVITGGIICILYLILLVIPVLIPGFIFALLLLLFWIDVFVIIGLTKKYHNFGLAFILMISMAFFFKSMRWPVTGELMTVGFSGLACFSFYSASVFLKKYNHSKFLKYIGFSSTMVLAIVSVGLLFKTMHWPGAVFILTGGLILFIPFLFAFVFTLPGSDYINWNKTDRAVFFRTVVIPMVFVYILCMMLFVVPDFWTNLIRHPLTPFNMFDFDLL